MRTSTLWPARGGRLLLTFAFVLSLIPFAIAPRAASASPNGVVISEFQFRGPTGGNDEFVELLNTSAVAVDISSWQLQGCAAASGAPSTRTTVPGGTVLQPGDHYLFTNSSGYSGSVVGDATYSTGLADTGGARIVASDSAVIDGVGSSDGAIDECREGAGLALPTQNGDDAFARLNDGQQDTDDNAADFAGPQASDPQNLGGGTQEPTITIISEIQGNGQSSPLVGQTVIIEGIVTGWDDEIGASFTGTFPEDAGIFVQEEPEDQDADAATSEAIFVGFVRFRQNYPLGSVVRLQGEVKEKFGLTMIAETINLEPEIVGSAPLPEPVVIDPALASSQNPASRDYYESLENMRVQLTEGTANSGGTNKFGELFLLPGSNQDRLFRTESAPALLATDADAGAGDPDNPFRDPDGSTTEVHADLFDRVENVVGPLAFSFGHYKIMVQQDLLPSVIKGPTVFPYAGLPPADDGEIRIASFNVENYFPAGSELDLGIVSPEEEATKRARIADAIGRALQAPDIVAVQEVATLEILTELANELGGYTAYLVDGNDERGIDVGYLIKDTVTASNLHQLGADAPGPAGVTCSDVAGGLFDRPPLLIDVTTPGGRVFTIINNHFASKSSPDACREAQATFVRDLVEEIEAAGGQAIVVGDLNAFEDENALAILQDGQTSLTNLWTSAPADERYSYAFEGKLQTLDHILITDGLDDVVSGFQYAHFDVNYYDRGGATAEALSDHAPPVLTLSDLAGEPQWSHIFSDGTATFYLDTETRSLRFTTTGYDTGVLSDPDMLVLQRVIVGRVRTDEVTVNYTASLVREQRAVVTVNDRVNRKIYLFIGKRV